jgi:hypothetical protein
MKTTPDTARNRRCITQCALATAALFLGACSATTSPKGGTERHGQVQFSSGKENIVGEIAIRHDRDNFHAEITKGPGVPLLTISAKFGVDAKSKQNTERQMISSRVRGPLVRGGLTYSPRDFAKKGTASDKLANPNYAWAALPEVFMWGEGEATGEAVRVTLPNLATHSRTRNGHVGYFDYSRHQNSSPVDAPLDRKTLMKLPLLEKVVCKLD